MKVLMLGWELPPHNSGGLGVACYNLGKALAKKGIDIDFIVPYSAPHQSIDFMHVLNATPLDPLFRFGGGAYVELVAEQIIPTMLAKTPTISIREIQEKYCDYIEGYLETNHPDFVHAHDWLTFEAGILAKKNYGVPLVAHVHATEFDRSGMNGGNKLIHEIEREGLLLADKILTVSATTKRLVHDKYNIPLDKIDVAYNSLDENFLRTPYDTKEDDLRYLEEMKRKGYTIVSTVGRFTIQKGLWHMMRAARLALDKNPKLLFVFAGDGEERDELVRFSADLGISGNVIFTGFVRGQKLRDIYAVSDIFIMSSVSEPFGLTALEAAHYGNILILTKQSGVSEVLRSAIVYDFWDDEKLADEIVAVSTSDSLKSTLKEGIRREYLKISWDEVADKIISTYKGIAS